MNLKWTIAISLAVMLVGAGIWMVLRGNHEQPPPGVSGKGVREDQQLPPIASVSLRVNRDIDVTLLRGTPFILSVRLARKPFGEL